MNEITQAQRKKELKSAYMATTDYLIAEAYNRGYSVYNIVEVPCFPKGMANGLKGISDTSLLYELRSRGYRCSTTKLSKQEGI